MYASKSQLSRNFSAAERPESKSASARFGAQVELGRADPERRDRNRARVARLLDVEAVVRLHHRLGERLHVVDDRARRRCPVIVGSGSRAPIGTDGFGSTSSRPKVGQSAECRPRSRRARPGSSRACRRRRSRASRRSSGSRTGRARRRSGCSCSSARRARRRARPARSRACSRRAAARAARAWSRRRRSPAGGTGSSGSSANSGWTRSAKVRTPLASRRSRIHSRKQSPS